MSPTPFSRNDPKRSWWPFVLGILFPLIAIYAILALSSIMHRDESPAVVTQPVQEPLGDAYITVKVLNHAGDPVTECEVSFLHDRAPEPGRDSSADATVYTSKTDSAGMATTTLPREGNVTIKVAGAGSVKRIKNMQDTSEKFYELTIVTNEGGTASP